MTDCIRIAYDVSVLGMGYFYQPARTGVFRVVDNVLHVLARTPGVHLTLCATDSIEYHDAARAYVASEPKLASLPFVGPSGNPITSGIRERMQQCFFALDSELRQPNSPTQFVRRGDWRPPARAVTPKTVARGVFRQSARVFRRFAGAPDLSALDIHVFHSPFHPIPEAVRAARGLGKVLTVYDLIPILFPWFVESGAMSELLRRALTSIRDDGFALCISESTKRDLCEYLDLDPTRAIVTHPAAADHLFYPMENDHQLRAVHERYGLPAGPYLLSLCTLEPRKNIDHTIRCFLRVLEQEHLKDLYLVLIGAKGWDYDRIFREIPANSRYRDRIIVTGFVADEDLAAIYSQALAFVYPSFYEGFGLPVLEAMKCRVPVIASNTSAIPEVIGDAGITLDPKDADALCDAIARVYRDRALREGLAARSLARAALFSWEGCVTETVRAYELAVRSR